MDQNRCGNVRSCGASVTRAVDLSFRGVNGGVGVPPVYADDRQDAGPTDNPSGSKIDSLRWQ